MRLLTRLLLCFFLITGNPIYSQQYKKVITEVAGAKDLCNLKLSKHVKISIEDGKPIIKVDTYSDLLYISEKSFANSTKSIYYYNDISTIEDIKAFTFVPTRSGKYKKMKVDNITSFKPTGDGVFYDDLQEKKVIFPGIEKGSIASLSYTQNILDPHFITSFHCFFSVFTVENECSITFPNTVSLKYIFKGDSSNVKFSRAQTGKTTTYTWKSVNLEAVSAEGNTPAYLHFSPHIILYIEEYIGKDGKPVKVYSDVKQLYNWYYSLISENYNSKDSGKIKYLVDSLINGIKDETEKIKIIYYWVQDNIKYIAFENGLGGYVPRPAESVCERKYGDCKDKANLLCHMLRHAGIQAHLTWIGTRDIPYNFSEVPTSVANHMIATVKNKNEWIFLDPTAYKLPFRLPPYAIQGKEALISIDKDSYLLKKVPVISNSENARVDSIFISLNGDMISGKGKTTFSGLWKNQLVGLYSRISNKDQKEAYENLLRLGNNKYKLDTVNIEHMDNTDKPIFMLYDFSLPNYINKSNSTIFINLQLYKNFLNDFISNDRKYPIEADYNYSQKQVIILKIPKGSEVQVPDNSSYTSPSFGYSIKYKKSAEKIIVENYFYNNTLMLEKKQFPEWNKMVGQLSKEYSNALMLNNKSFKQ